MLQVNITELRSHLPAYLEQVHTGTEILITSRKQIIARLLPPYDARNEACEQLKKLRKNCKIGDTLKIGRSNWNVVGILVRDVAGLGIRRNDDERDASYIAEEVEDLSVAGVVIAAAFVGGNENGCALPELGVGLDCFHNLLDEAFIEIPL